jgi:hypothetical protein
MPNQTPISRYILAAIAALMLYAGMPVATEAFHAWKRRAADREAAPRPFDLPEKTKELRQPGSRRAVPRGHGGTAVIRQASLPCV